MFQSEEVSLSVARNPIFTQPSLFSSWRFSGTCRTASSVIRQKKEELCKRTLSSLVFLRQVGRILEKLQLASIINLVAEMLLKSVNFAALASKTKTRKERGNE